MEKEKGTKKKRRGIKIYLMKRKRRKLKDRIGK